MRTRSIIIAAIVAVNTLFVGVSLSQQNNYAQNPNAQDPVRPRRDPISSSKSSLIKSPPPYSIPGNDIVTGNVGGGKEFRGSVPYGSPTDFRGPTASSSFDPFLRYSIPTNYSYSPTYQPFYSPTRTVTTQKIGGEIFRPAGTNFGGRPTDEIYARSALEKKQALEEKKLPYDIDEFMKLTPRQQKLEQEVLSDAEKYKNFSELTAEQRQQQIEKMFKEMGLENPNKDEDKTDVKDSRFEKKQPEPFAKEKLKPDRYLKEKEPAQAVKEEPPADIYEQVKKNIEEIQKDQPLQPKPEPGQEQELNDYEKLMLKLKEQQESSSQTQQQQTNTSTEPTTTETGNIMDKMPSGTELEAQAKNILGHHKDFTSYTEDKFNQYLLLGNKLLEEGKYYRAVNSYNMSLVYKPENLLATAGKGHALFGAGEYMTAAMFLSDVLKKYPQYINAKITIKAMVGNRDTIDARMTEIDQLLEKTDVPELNFLQAYFYYRTDRLDNARKKIDIVLQKVPNLKAADVLKKAIEQASKKD